MAVSKTKRQTKILVGKILLLIVVLLLGFVVWIRGNENSQFKSVKIKVGEYVQAGQAKYKLEDKLPNFNFMLSDGSAALAFNLQGAREALAKKLKRNKVIYRDVFKDVDVEYESYEDRLKENIILKSPRAQKVFIYDLSRSFEKVKDFDLLLINNIFVALYNKQTGEELIMLEMPKVFDAQGRRIAYHYRLQKDSQQNKILLILEPFKNYNFLDFEYPIVIDPPVSVRQCDEVLVKVGQNGTGPGNAKDGDIVMVKPCGWPWGKMERRDYVIVRVPKLSQAQREKFLRRVEEGNEMENSKESLNGAIQYAIDYTKLATEKQLKIIRNYDKNNPILDATKLPLEQIIQKKSNPLTSVIPKNKRLSARIDKQRSWWRALADKIIKPVLAATNTYTIGTASRDYSTLQAWEDARDGDLVTAGNIEKGEVYNDSVFTAGITIDGSTTDSSHYMWLTVAEADRHDGTAGSGARIDADSLTAVIDNLDEYTKIEWLEIYDSTFDSTQNKYAIRAKDGYGTYAYLIIHDIGDGSGGTDNSAGFTSWTGHDAETEKVYNNIFYNIHGQGIQAVGSIQAYNNTFYNNYGYGIMDYGTYCDISTISCDWRNNIAVGNNAGSGGAGDFEVANLDEGGYMVNNLSSDGTADDCTSCAMSLDNLVNKTAADQFVSTATPDLHLTTGADAINTGTSTPETIFTDDIDTDSRNNRRWDIGADEWGVLSNTTYTDPTSNGTGSNCSYPEEALVSDDLPAICLDTQVVDVDSFGFSLPTGSVLDGIEVRVEWRVKNGTFQLSCQLLNASGNPVGDTKITAVNSSTVDITDILGDNRDLWGTNFSKTDIEDTDFGVRCTASKISGVATAQARIDNIDINIIYTEPAGGGTNNSPTITSVTDSPDPVTVGKDINFSVDWNDVDAGENIKVKICKTDSLTNQNCDGGYWATSTVFTTNDPETVSYSVQTGDEGTHNYYAFVCDDEGACSASTSGSFTVAPTISLVTDSPDPIGVGAELIFSVDWNDSDNGEMVKVHICKGSGIATSTQTCSDGSWADAEVFSNRDPLTVVYTTQESDKGSTHNYWAFVCDDSNACSDGTAGTFTVENQRPDAPVSLLVEGMEVGNALNITDTTPEFSVVYKDSNDEGDVAVKYCIQVNTSSDFSGTDMWVSDSDSCYTGSTIGSNVAESQRTPDFSYAGSSLSLDGTTYYWRAWLWDGEERSATSTTGWFKMADSSAGGGVRLKGGRLKGGIRLK